MARAHRYRRTESKYRGGADEMYITYGLEQRTRSGESALYPKVKRVYIAGDVKDWKVGDFERKTGRKVHGVKIDYEQERSAYRRKAFTARRGTTSYSVSPAQVGATHMGFSQVVEVPEKARHVRFCTGKLPTQYQQSLQHVR